jgi:hypothetical protein
VCALKRLALLCRLCCSCAGMPATPSPSPRRGVAADPLPRTSRDAAGCPLCLTPSYQPFSLRTSRCVLVLTTVPPRLCVHLNAAAVRPSDSHRRLPVCDGHVHS